MREKNGITSILKQISFMKDNCYHLNRAMWNEVNEEWPFYTESERQMLKRYELVVLPAELLHAPICVVYESELSFYQIKNQNCVTTFCNFILNRKRNALKSCRRLKVVLVVVNR